MAAPTSSTSILPILLPPPTLRPLAFRIFTKKHSLTITASSLQSLATFVGRNCGSGWREGGLAELVLDEIAKTWKKAGGGLIVEDGGTHADLLKSILKNLEPRMNGGRVIIRDPSKDSEAATLVSGKGELSRTNRTREGKPDSNEERLEIGDDSALHDARRWIRVVSAFEQNRPVYNVNKKNFDIITTPPSLFPSASQRANIFRDRYNLIYQRLLRNEAFQIPLQQSNSSHSSANRSYKVTSIANLLGRSGTSHLLLGLLSVSPAGELSISDPTGSITLDIRDARAVPEDGSWFTPGMIVLADGVYREEEVVSGSTLTGSGGVGGTIGGKFIVASVGGPPCERREVSSGAAHHRGADGDMSVEGGFGWVDFLGVGSERSRGPRMRQIEKICLHKGQPEEQEKVRKQIVVMGEVNLDVPKTVEALSYVFQSYTSFPEHQMPLVFILIGNFFQDALMSGGGSSGGIECKEYFDILASVLSKYPRLLQNSTFVFVPGDNDPWASAYSAGASTTSPRDAIPDLFTSRVKRAFTNANNAHQLPNSRHTPGQAIWTSNPTRLSLFGPVHELVVFRDDVSERLRRNSIVFKPQKPQEVPQARKEPIGTDKDMDLEYIDHNEPPPPEGDETKQQEQQQDQINQEKPLPTSTTKQTNLHASRKLVKTILDQNYLSPFPQHIRPVLWDYASVLHLYPLPTAMVLADSDAEPFAVTYEGCHVMNPGRLIPEGSRSLVRWIEYDVAKKKGRVKEERF
ncbi:DNA polymerase epsilon subunit B [Paracoccidioides lutzii Pb01]|uniref:DNA polymerase epsilon subunit B n=1 Tax=Paracoccidioides lutzii (strain ATCC MYA-826 / Pb01) TaxID=502779 RepID=C1GR39_PARBA|nr:DNA polymerase epsilon subunit B [Paracoccidioides lutzii Pb01]EEH38063.1 DNA polymerase epsilon subunit B [Paracoccidioides lutzii Pb01]